jgi:hypothetical protein
VCLCAGNDSLLQLLVEKGANVNEKVQGGVTPLHVAADIGSESLIQTLLAVCLPTSACLLPQPMSLQDPFFLCLCWSSVFAQGDRRHPHGYIDVYAIKTSTLPLCLSLVSLASKDMKEVTAHGWQSLQ